MGVEERGWWSEIVPVRTSGARTLNVNNSAQAARLLLTEWPAPAVDTAKHLAARRAVLKALENYRDQRALQRARKAFADAAEEAGIAAG